MLKVQFIGTLGADCEKKVAEGSKFTTFRAAHNEVWKDDAGEEHSSTMWVDCVMSDHPNVADYLVSGQQVYVEGYPSLRVYSSQKDRCMKAGMTIRVQKIELLGGRPDSIPRELYDDAGTIHKVEKYYLCPDAKKATLMDKRGRQYQTDNKGWITPVTNQSTQQEDAQQNG